MLLVLTLLTLIPCLVLLTLYLFSAGGKSGGNKKNDGVKVSPPPPPHSWHIRIAGAFGGKRRFGSMVGPSVARGLFSEGLLLVVLHCWIACIILSSTLKAVFQSLNLQQDSKSEKETLH